MSVSVLVACECSGKVRQAFRDRGIDAWSNDIKPADDDSPFHYQGDCMEFVTSKQWDLIIAHPDCTAMAVSGNRWYGQGMPLHDKRIDAVRWTRKLWTEMCFHSARCALENPVSVIFQYLNAPVQYVQPWQFGHGETKKTGFALCNLPPLSPTNVVEGREQRIWKMPPSADRKAKRSETYQGIANAIAGQWGELLAGKNSDE